MELWSYVEMTLKVLPPGISSWSFQEVACFIAWNSRREMWTTSRSLKCYFKGSGWLMFAKTYVTLYHHASRWGLTLFLGAHSAIWSLLHPVASLGQRASFPCHRWWMEASNQLRAWWRHLWAQLSGKGKILSLRAIQHQRGGLHAKFSLCDQVSAEVTLSFEMTVQFVCPIHPPAQAPSLPSSFLSPLPGRPIG